MLDLASENVDAAFQAVISGPDEKTEKAIRTEELVDLLNKEISHYVAKAMVRETNAEDSAAVASGFRIAGNIERISDHAMNILGYGQRLEKENIQLSDEALKELMEMRTVCAKALRYLRQGAALPAWRVPAGQRRPAGADHRRHDRPFPGKPHAPHEERSVQRRGLHPLFRDPHRL